VRETTHTRERILLAAVELFYSRGYAATEMADILKKARANSGSFYFFFKGKEDLLHERTTRWSASSCCSRTTATRS